MKILDRKPASFKGQAIMEYLITYGLALFVILIVLAILVAVVLPSLKAPEACQFTQPGFTCNSKPHAIVADSGNNIRLLFQVDNVQGKSVKVLGFLCTTAAPSNVRVSDVDDRGVDVTDATQQAFASGQSKSVGNVGGGGSTPSDIPLVIDCVDGSGNPVVLSPNSNFKGTLAMRYQFSEDVPGAPQRLAVATVTGSVVAE
ncbi:MAG TPA: hypothetical protein VLD37_04840 [Candidatus Bilamarchaeum sp.]|nr:hypothetical protein [Candidatus Bilamarchaeum sp.]